MFAGHHKTSVSRLAVASLLASLWCPKRAALDPFGLYNENAIVGSACVRCCPSDHPSSKLAGVATTSSLPSWWTLDRVK